MSKIIQVAFEGSAMQFNHDGWFNATVAAERFGKRPNDWLLLPDTENYIAALNESLGSNTGLSGIWVKTKRGNNGGTWLHPKLAVVFARWLDVRFAVWCDTQIDSLLRGLVDTAQDWRRVRHEARSTNKTMCMVLNICRTADGKDTKSYHYMNEAKLVNWALTGEYKGLDRDSLSFRDLDILAQLEAHNAVMIAQGKPYDGRKEALCLLAATLRQQQLLSQARRLSA